MKLDILKALNEERAARRPVIIVTNQDSGTQRLVKSADILASQEEDCESFLDPQTDKTYRQAGAYILPPDVEGM